MPDAQALVTVRDNYGGCWIIIDDPMERFTERSIRISELPFPNGTPFRIWADRALHANLSYRADLAVDWLPGTEDDAMDERVEACGWQQQPETNDWRLFVPMKIATRWRSLCLESRQVARLMAEEAEKEWRSNNP